jgi:hypothetical protein
MPWRSRVLGAVLVALVLAGCGTGHEDAVRAVGEEYAAAVASRDWSAACDLLAPTTRQELEQSAGKPCAEALPEEDPPVVEGAPAPSIFGTQAQLHYAADTLFLSPYDGAWRIVAAVCTPRAERPYDCSVSGG